MRFLVATLLLAVIPACGDRPPETLSRTYFVFGTEVSIQAYGQPAKIQPQLAVAQQLLRRRHREWHAWEPGLLDSLNEALASGRCYPVNPPLRALLIQAAELETATGGLFNAGAGNLIRRWGFHTSEFPIRQPPPTPEELAQLTAARPGLTQLIFNPDCIASSNPAVRIDLGAIGKGAAIDEVVDQLRDAGIPAALVNAGGDLRGYGAPGRPWRVAIRRPGSGPARPLAVLHLREDEAVVTSGGYARYVQHEQERYPHILDPRTGLPAAGPLSVTVVAHSASVADAAATALMIGGLPAVAQTRSLAAVQHLLLITDDGCIHVDPALEDRLQWPEAPACVETLDAAQ
ncbi:MAG: FAD:protein FMN transferase [Pseudomonadota bacterium]